MDTKTIDVDKDKIMVNPELHEWKSILYSLMCEIENQLLRNDIIWYVKVLKGSNKNRKRW